MKHLLLQLLKLSARAKARPKSARREDGFTLVELMVVVVIIGLLATVVVLNVLPSQDTAMKEKARADVAKLEEAVELYRLDMMSYPTTEQGLEALVEQPQGLARPERYRQGGYIKRLPEDPWGNPYRYVYPGEESAFDIYSTGADGRNGGEGLDADIGNWN
ncbi:MAG: type II secretion system major pseudopilin GspG [Alphaproteobacteria bacterium]|nr:type II secretion system major pseudopilin GspG [Alphaproteobacteria bacterium]